MLSRFFHATYHYRGYVGLHSRWMAVGFLVLAASACNSSESNSWIPTDTSPPPTLTPPRLTVMSYNVLHGQPCSGGSRGEEVAARMELAVQGPPKTHCDFSNPTHTCGLADLAPDVLGLQEVGQVFTTKVPASEDQACAFTGTPEGVDSVTAHEHSGDYLLRRLNGVSAARRNDGESNESASPYKMRFTRDNPRLIPIAPDLPLAPDDKSLSDHAADLANVEIGTAIVSALNIQQVTVHNLTADETPGGSRTIQHATIRDGGGRAFDFYNSHLTTGGGDQPLTVLMAMEIVRFIQTTRRHSENPAFFTCDCNAEPQTTSYEIFVSAGFVDSFAAANSLGNASAQQNTSGRDNLNPGCPQDGEGARKRIDYVWAIPNGDGMVPEVVNSSVVMDYHAGTSPPDRLGCLWPSDHNGVITTFEVELNAPPGVSLPSS